MGDDELIENFQEKMTELLKKLGDPESLGVNGHNPVSLPKNMKAVKKYLFEGGPKPAFDDEDDRVDVNEAHAALQSVKDIITDNPDTNFEEAFEEMVEDFIDNDDDDDDDEPNNQNNQGGGAHRRYRKSVARRKSYARRKSRKGKGRKSKSRKSRRGRKLTRRHTRK
jgi:hypothetical protein